MVPIHFANKKENGKKPHVPVQAYYSVAFYLRLENLAVETNRYGWCLGRESNSYGDTPRGILSPLRLPIPPPRQNKSLSGYLQTDMPGGLKNMDFINTGMQQKSSCKIPATHG
jgi:hypothetical protein